VEILPLSTDGTKPSEALQTPCLSWQAAHAPCWWWWRIARESGRCKGSQVALGDIWEITWEGSWEGNLGVELLEME